MSMKTVNTITKIGDNPLLPRLTLIIITFQLLSRISYAITQHAKKNCDNYQSLAISLSPLRLICRAPANSSLVFLCVLGVFCLCVTISILYHIKRVEFLKSRNARRAAAIFNLEQQALLE